MLFDEMIMTQERQTEFGSLETIEEIALAIRRRL